MTTAVRVRIEGRVQGVWFRAWTVKEASGAPPAAEEMVRQLTRDQELVAKTARSIFDAAERARDEPTADLLTQRLQIHEKTAWMLRALGKGL